MKKLLFTLLILLLPSVASAATIGKVNANNLGLVGWWTLDGNDNTGNFADRSGFGFHARSNGFTATTTVPGQIGQAIVFDGVNDDIRTTTSPGSTGLMTTTATISVWIKPNTISGERAIYQQGFAWWVSQNGSTLEWRNNLSGLSGNVSSASVVKANVWQHVVFVGTPTSLKIYYNGTLITSSTNTILSSGTNGRDQFGSTDSRYFSGAMDDLRLYTRELSPKEVAALYNSGSAKVGRTTASYASSTPALSQGLVGYWTFDGPDMIPNLRDKTGFGNNMILNNFTSTTTVPGRTGQGLKFNGQNNFTSVNTTAYLFSTTTFTVSAWIKEASSSSSLNTPFIENSDGNSSSWALFLTSASCGGVVGFDVLLKGNGGGNAQNRCSTSNLNNNKWHHVVGVITTDSAVTANNLVTLYVDGKLDQQAAQGGTTPYDTARTGVFQFGKRNGSATFFDGSLDDVRIYNRGLSAAEVAALYQTGSTKVGVSSAAASTTPLSNGLTGYWTFDGSKTNWATGKTFDSSGNGNTGQLTSMSTSTTPALGKVGQAFRFDGISSYVATSTFAYQFSNTTFTVSAWIKTSSTAQNGIVDQGDGTNTGWMLGMSINCTGGQITAFAKDVTNSQVQRCSTSLVSDGKWHHVLAVIKTDTSVSGNQNIDLYIDGALNQGALLPSSGGYRQNSGVLNIGRRSQTNIYFNGNIDDVRIYSRGLSAQEIMQLYNAR